MEFKIQIYCCMFRDCGREYFSRQNLKRHINISHLFKKKTTCNICFKTFINSVNLKEHYLIHSNSKPYKCSMCNMRFRYKAKLGSHKRVHQPGYIIDDSIIDKIDRENHFN